MEVFTSTLLSCLLINLLCPVQMDKKEKHQMFVPANLLIKDLFVFWVYSLHPFFCHCYFKSRTCCGNVKQLNSDNNSEGLCLFDLCFQAETSCHQGTSVTSLEGEMPDSFSSSGNAFKYSQMLQARRLNLSVVESFGGKYTTLEHTLWDGGRIWPI